jgi:hypothetical protein
MVRSFSMQWPFGQSERRPDCGIQTFQFVLVPPKLPSSHMMEAGATLLALSMR